MKLKSILIAMMLSASGIQLNAQSEKPYDYGEIVLSMGTDNVITVYTPQGQQEFKIEKNDDAQAAIIKKVNELAKGGWEVYNVAEQPIGGVMKLTYFIRKLKNEITDKPKIAMRGK